MSNINEELKHMKYLLGYKKGVIISEQKIVNEVDDETDLEDVTTTQTTDPKTKTIKGGIGAKFGNQEFNWLGIQRSPTRIGLDFEYTKELNQELNTAGDILGKMNEEIDDKDYVSLPNDLKVKLANGFYNAIEELINKQDFSKYDKKALRKIKKFFKKSQRWSFSVDELNDSDDGKNYSKVKLDVPSKGEITVLEEVKNEVTTALQTLNDNNTNGEIILGDQASVFKFFNKTSEYEVIPQTKKRLSTIFSHISVPIDAKEEKPKTTGIRSSGTEVDVDKIPLNYLAGKSDPTPYLTEVMKQVYTAIYSSKVTFDTESGTNKTMTIKEMLDCGDQRCAEIFDVYITDVECIASASNTWKDDVLDYTHENDDTEVKKASELSTSGNNLKNLKLAKERGNKLVQSVLEEIQRTPGIRLYRQFNYNEDILMEFRVTNTGGKVDQDPKKDAKYPNPGQYAKFKFGIGVSIQEKVTNPAVNLLKGQINQRQISLRYIGKKDSSFNINFDIIPGSKQKSVYLRKSIFGNKGHKTLPQWKSNMRYNNQQRKWGNSDRRKIFGNYRT